MQSVSDKITRALGSPASILIHTFIFIASFVAVFAGIPFDRVLLILTTAVSLEAIYLSLFIQMTVNRHAESLEGVEEDIEEISEDIEGITEDIEDISEDIEEISEDIDDIQEEDTEDEKHEKELDNTLGTIREDLKRILADLDRIKDKK